MHVLIIGNPIAGKGRAVPRIRRMAALLEEEGHDVEVFLTEKAGDAMERARRIQPDVERLVIAGGDGTVHEVLNGLPDPSRVPLLHLSVGTANMLARDLGLPGRTEDLARLVVQGGIKKLDMGRVGEHRFLLLASAGFDALVTRVVKHSRGKRLGYTGYFLPIVKALRSYQPPEILVSIDDGDSLPAAAVMVSNVRHYGGFFVFGNEARLDSGFFDITIFRNAGIPALFISAFYGLMRQVSLLPWVTQVKGTRVRIESANPVPVQLDGDYFGTTPISMEILPSVIPVIVPAGS